MVIRGRSVCFLNWSAMPDLSFSQFMFSRAIEVLDFNLYSKDSILSQCLQNKRRNLKVSTQDPNSLISDSYNSKRIICHSLNNPEIDIANPLLHLAKPHRDSTVCSKYIQANEELLYPLNYVPF